MNKFLLMLIVCIAAQRVYSKTIFDYNINPEYDLVAEESAARYSNFRPSSEYRVAPRRRIKHHVMERGHGGYHGKRKHDLPRHAADLSDGYIYAAASDEYGYFEQPYHSPHYHHPHGFPPGQAKKHGSPYGHPHGHPYVIPPRFPPPPVYDKNFLNPWTLSGTPSTQFFGQQPPLTSPQHLFEQHPYQTTPAVYVAPKLTTTTAAPSRMSSTTTDDQLLYDIDVRFGGD